MSARRGERGFTLVELLVALTLLGLVSLMLVGGLRFGSRSWERTVATSESLNALVATQRFLRDRLEAASGEVAGDGQNLWFESVWLTSLGAPGLYRFELTLSEEGALTVAWRPALEDEDAPPPEALTGERALMEGVEALRIGYYGLAPEAEAADWLDVWEAEGERPRLVRIELEMEDPRVVWPLFIAALAN